MFSTPLHLPRPFQAYLLPSLPFRRRNSSITSRDSTITTSTSSSTDAPPYVQVQAERQAYLNTHGSTSTISCSRCHAHLALTTQIISKGFTGRHGRAYLVSSFDPTSPTTLRTKPDTSSKYATPPGALPNTHTHKPVPRNLVTGAHTVSDVSCAVCGAVVGWKYVGAAEEAQRYKVGKFILETRRVAVRAVWEAFDIGNDEVGEHERTERREGKEGTGELDDVVFDSQDEEECEDLFAGNWSASGARRRRAKRLGLRS